ncbi:hypothetical protein Jab_2c13070 [Janthinobacterium sp. HH01]|uniref:hypothetical protein n=1 Tax=Janthinobacterium sp. HH01 TaxID=1198452 RepID=UPI0002AEDD37|nr:hypothetical protein [Janthinobacterium sp. HH01]ELX09245.1 hypothetical protein Jab_2c13070 [Janthinobacterium sp. HH01]
MAAITPAGLALALLSLSLGLPALAGDDAEARATFTVLYAKMNAAMSTKNIAELGAMLAPAYQGEDVAGKARNARQMLQEISELKDYPNRKLETTFSAVTLEGSLAKTVRRLRVTSSKAPDDKTPTMEYVAVSDDTWTRGERGWQLSASTVRQADFSMYGKVLIHKTHEAR